MRQWGKIGWKYLINREMVVCGSRALDLIGMAINLSNLVENSIATNPFTKPSEI